MISHDTHMTPQLFIYKYIHNLNLNLFHTSKATSPQIDPLRFLTLHTFRMRIMHKWFSRFRVSKARDGNPNIIQRTLPEENKYSKLRGFVRCIYTRSSVYWHQECLDMCGFCLIRVQTTTSVHLRIHYTKSRQVSMTMMLNISRFQKSFPRHLNVWEVLGTIKEWGLSSSWAWLLEFRLYRAVIVPYFISESHFVRA